MKEGGKRCGRQSKKWSHVCEPSEVEIIGFRRITRRRREGREKKGWRIVGIRKKKRNEDGTQGAAAKEERPPKKTEGQKGLKSRNVDEPSLKAEKSPRKRGSLANGRNNGRLALNHDERQSAIPES